MWAARFACCRCTDGPGQVQFTLQPHCVLTAAVLLPAGSAGLTSAYMAPWNLNSVTFPPPLPSLVAQSVASEFWVSKPRPLLLLTTVWC